MRSKLSLIIILRISDYLIYIPKPIVTDRYITRGPCAPVCPVAPPARLNRPLVCAEVEVEIFRKLAGIRAGLTERLNLILMCDKIVNATQVGHSW